MSQYVITRSDELYHFGIKGQKWGVRRFENLDGTLTEAGKERYGVSNNGVGNDRFAKKYSKSLKKLERAYENADLKKQINDYAKYEKRAKVAKRIGNGALAIGIPAAGVLGVNAAFPKVVSAAKKAVLKVNEDAGDAYTQMLYSDPTAYEKLVYNHVHDGTQYIGSPKKYTDEIMSRQREIANKSYDAHERLTKLEDQFDERVRNDIHTVSSIISNVAFAAAGASYGVAAYSKIRSNIAKRRISEVGHSKAVAKAKQLTEKFSNTFANTPYKAMLDTQVEMYKDMHPNTTMSDKEIIKSLMPAL